MTKRAPVAPAAQQAAGRSREPSRQPPSTGGENDNSNVTADASRRDRGARRDDVGIAGRLRRWRGPLALAAIALAGASASGWFAVATAQLRDSRAAANAAVADPAGTALVIKAVGGEITEVFSYSYTDPAATRRAAGSVLAGRALRQYDELFSLVVQNAAGQRLTVRTRVVRAGVMRMSGSQAQVLVFIDQQATRAGRPSGGPVAAQLAVTAQRGSGRWRITSIESR